MRLLLALLLLGSAPEGGVVSGTVAAPEGAGQKRLRQKLEYASASVVGHKDPDPSPIVVWLEGAGATKVEAKTVDVLQDGLEFRPRILAVGVGSTVRFPNGDDLFHNVFSYSKAQRFDLGRYPKGESKSVTFDKKGQVDVRCEVHDHMRAYIHVFDHPWFALAAADGAFALPKVPPGKYTLVAWKEFFSPVRQEIEVKSEGLKFDLKLARLEERPADRPVGAGCCNAR